MVTLQTYPSTTISVPFQVYVVSLIPADDKAVTYKVGDSATLVFNTCSLVPNIAGLTVSYTNFATLPSFVVYSSTVNLYTVYTDDNANANQVYPLVATCYVDGSSYETQTTVILSVTELEQEDDDDAKTEPADCGVDGGDGDTNDTGGCYQEIIDQKEDEIVEEFDLTPS